MADSVLDFNINMSPTRLELELTELCNLRCSFCYNSQNPLVSDLYEDIIERLVAENVFEIVLTGGEPMAHPKFKNILTKCCSSFNKVMVQTNGTYIDSSYAKLFKELGVFSVNVSLHGDKVRHETLTRVFGSYDKAFNAIGFLIQNNVRVASNFVLTTKNIDILEENILSLYNAGLRKLTITHFTPTGVGSENKDLAVSTTDLISALYVAKTLMETYKDLKIILANSIAACALPQDLKFFSEQCHFGVSRFYIDIHGNVMMCGMSRIKIGNILEKSFSEIKRESAVYCNHVQCKDLPKECLSCADFNFCRGGCRAAAYATSGRLDGKDPYFTGRY